MKQILFPIFLSFLWVACRDLPQSATLDMERVAGRDTTFALRAVCTDEVSDSFYVVAPYADVEALPLNLSSDLKTMLLKETMLDDRCTILLCKGREVRSYATVKRRDFCDFAQLPQGRGISMEQPLQIDGDSLKLLE